MPRFDLRSLSALSSRRILARLTVAIMFILAVATQSSERGPSRNPTPNPEQVHWHKYVNKEFGFSLRYPDTYRPSEDAEYCKDNYFRRYLLCLERRDDSQTTIVVTVVTGAPFFIKKNRGDNEYTRQKIGRHLFYCGVSGSMGVGFSDECTFNLRGKALELSFFPSETINSEVKTNPLMFKALKTFRTF